MIFRWKEWWRQRVEERRRSELRKRARGFDPRSVKLPSPHTDAVERGELVLPLQFFSIVLNGMDFLPRQWEVLRSLPGPWIWHVVEGAAQLVGDTGWSLQRGGRLAGEFHREGRSVDGTVDFLHDLAEQFPERVKLHTKEGLWQGKREMVNTPLAALPDECLLWQLDVDEMWTAAQIEQVWRTVQKEPQRTGAQFFCRFFVAPNRLLLNGGLYGNDPVWEWRRVWRYRRGDEWGRHEPPRLWRQTSEGPRDLFDMHPLTWEETVGRGWVFDHLAYVVESQVRFKEAYYGYQGAVDGWHKLCEETAEMVEVAEYLPWIPRGVWACKTEN